MEKEFSAELGNLYPILEFVQQHVGQWGFSELEAKEIELVVEEVIINVINYAYTDSAGLVVVECQNPQTGKCVIVVKDQGVAFNPLAQFERCPRTPEGLKEGKGGFGIFIVLSIMDKVNYNREQGWNILTLEKTRQPSQTGERLPNAN